MKPLLSLALGLAVVSAAAQPVAFETVCTMYDHGAVAEPGPTLDRAALEQARRGTTYTRVVTQSNATFQVDYSSGFTPQAQAAFQRAVDIWAAHLTSPAIIRIKADFIALDSRVLGQAGPRLTRFTSGERAGRWYPLALADAIAGQDLSGAAVYDIEAVFNSAQTRFYYGLDGNPPGGSQGQYDFVTIVLHELGHGLGFIGSGEVDDGTGDVECTGVSGIGCLGLSSPAGTPTYPFIFDTFLVDSDAVSILNTAKYPNPSRPLGVLLQSQNLFANGPETRRIYGARVPIWAPTLFEFGSSFSHWDEVVIRNSSAALMTPALAPGEAYQDPGDITCAYFRDMGWQLAGGCQGLTVADEPAPLAGALGLEPTGPNPFRETTTFRLRTAAPGPVRATLHDALGRQLAVLFDGTAGSEESITVDGRGLAQGVYRVVVRSGGETVTRVLTLVR